MNRIYALLPAFLLSLALAAPPPAAGERLSVITGGQTVGHLEATTEGARTVIVYDYRNNGRGPTLREAIEVDAAGLPIRWSIDGTTTFGNPVSERYSTDGQLAAWTDSTGSATAAIEGPTLYVAQGASPWALGLYARAALRMPGQRITTLPSGTLAVERGPDVVVAGAPGPVTVTRHTLTGIDMTPSTVLLDRDGGLFAFVTPSFIVVREGHESEEERLRGLAATWATERLQAIQREVAHRAPGPVRIRNVRIFDPRTLALSAPASVVVEGRGIKSIEPARARPRSGEVVVDGAGGTLLPGLFEMHGHLSQEGGLLNIVAGVTSVRDMGNDNPVLDLLVQRIESGQLAGPRVVRSGFIEGRSPFNSNNGIVVASEAEALDAVRWYAGRGYWQIKVYNSMKPEWVPAVVAESHRLGLRVAGHVPAFTTADAMIEAGYDELVHSNQLMLSWVLGADEDTRTLLRLTALKRLANFDLSSPPARKTFELMASRKVVHDPTLTILEALMTNRNGAVPAGAVDWFDHMPPGTQRSLKQALADVSAPGDDEAYRGAFASTMAAMRELHRRGIMIVPGTDFGGGLWLHRELELLEQAGLGRGEVLARATLDMARYLGREAELGSIEPGKLADFFLVPGNPLDELRATKRVAMVVKDGTFYFPEEILPRFGVRPLAAKPAVRVPKGSTF